MITYTQNVVDGDLQTVYDQLVAARDATTDKGEKAKITSEMAIVQNLKTAVDNLYDVSRQIVVFNLFL